MTGVELLHVNVLDDARNRRECGTPKWSRHHAFFRVPTVDGRYSATEPAALRQGLSRTAELEPIAVQVVAEPAHGAQATAAVRRHDQRSPPRRRRCRNGRAAAAPARMEGVAASV